MFLHHTPKVRSFWRGLDRPTTAGVVFSVALSTNIHWMFVFTLRIYEWISYILILGATVVYFILRSRGAWALNLTLCILVLAIFCRLMMERTRRLAADAENDQLKDDLRRLTQLYAEEKKKNNA